VITTDYVAWSAKFVHHCIRGLLLRFASGEVATSPEARQDSEMRKYVGEYVEMKPIVRQKRYGIQSRIMDNASVVPYRYLRKRALRQGAFTNDPRGFDAALNSTITALVKDGVLYRISEDKANLEYGLRCVLYGITGPMQVYVKQGVGYVQDDDSEAWAAGLGLRNR